MIKIIFLLITLMLSTTTKANIVPQNFGYKICSHHKFTFFLLKLYDVYLCADDKQYLYVEKIFKTDFSLIINYNMNFASDELAKSSMEEMGRYYQLNQEDQSSYYNQLMSIFPNIKKSDIVEVKYDKKGLINFYHNNLFIGQINDKKFSRIFLDIWLYKDNKYKKMTKDLFRKNEQN
jgi:hypothetical protein